MMAASILLKVTVVLAFALAATRLARATRAAARHVVLAAAFVVLLVLPLASYVAPAVRVPVPAAVQQAIAPLDAELVIDDAASPASAATAAPAAPAAPSVDSRAWPAWSTWLFAGWSAGWVVLLLPVAVGLWQMRALRRSARPWREASAAVETLAVQAGMRRRVDVLLHEALPGPMTCGLLHPAIVLPIDAPLWSEEDLQRALVHEIEHIRRGDWLSQCVVRVASACYWFHPLVWVAERQLLLEAERACDDAVLRKADAIAYADQLVVLARRLSAAASRPQLAMANCTDLPTRILAVLDGRQRRGRAGVLWLSAASIASVLVVVAMSPLRVVAATDGSGTTSGQAADRVASRRFEVASVKPCDGGNLPPGARGGGSGSGISPGRLNLECQLVIGFIQAAYVMFPGGVRSELGAVFTTPIEGGPDWIRSERYTIEAKAADAPSREMMQGPMLQAVLEDRFKLKIRRETREIQLYELTVAKGGPKLPRFQEGSCVPLVLTVPPTPQPELAPGQRRCARGSSMKGANRAIDAEGLTLREFNGSYLNGSPMAGLNTTVIDRTGLTGKFDFHLQYAPAPDDPARRDAIDRGADPGEPTAPDIITALQDQLGLKLVPAKGPGTFLVVDHIERPVPNSDVAADAGQASTAPSPRTFEAASIKPCAAEALPPTQTGGRAAGPGNATTSPGRAHWECATLDQLVNTAYASVDQRLLNDFGPPRSGDPRTVRGGPAWVYSDKFTVDAKAADAADRATLIGPMLRALLEDRFKVKTHRATEERSMYALTVAKGGLKIQPTAPGDCWVPDATTQPAGPPGAEGQSPCGNLHMSWNGGNRTLTYTGVLLQSFTDGLLSGLMDRFVINRTGLEGRFNIPLEFAPDDSTPGGIAGLAWSRREGATPPTAPSIFKALEELGLKLESTKAPAEYLVLDHVERPTPDIRGGGGR